VIWHSWFIKDTNSAALCVFSHSSTTLLRPALDALCSGLSSKLDMICLERESNQLNAIFYRNRKRTGSVDTTGMDLERMFFVMHHPMDAETHNIPSGEQKRKGFSVGIRWLRGRGLHTTRSRIAQIVLGFNVGMLGSLSRTMFGLLFAYLIN